MHDLIPNSVTTLIGNLPQRYRQLAYIQVINNIDINEIVRIIPTDTHENSISNLKPKFNIENLKQSVIKFRDSEEYSYKFIHDNPTCSICTYSILGDDDIIILSCQHIFHINCVTVWLIKNGTCPNCRDSVLSTSIH